MTKGFLIAICIIITIALILFPLTGNTFILLMTKEIDKKAIIKKDKNTIPNDLKFDLRFKTCFVEIISPAKIQN